MRDRPALGKGGQGGHQGGNPQGGDQGKGNQQGERKSHGRGRARQQPSGKRASHPWINSQIIQASESGGLPHLMATVMSHLPQMNLVNLSTAVHRIAKLTANDYNAQAYLRNNPGFEELLRKITAALGTTEANEAQPQSLSNIAWSLATMRLMHRPLVQVVSALAVTNISVFKPFELSTMLWAFAKLTTIDSSSWCMKPVFQAAATHIMKKMAEFGFRCLATTAWAFATARQRHARLFRCIGAQMVAMSHVANCQEIANTAWAFGTADFHDDLLFMELAEKAMPRLDEFKPQELSNMLWGFATNGFFHEAFFTHASVVTQQMELQAQHLANILWAFVRVRPRRPVTHATILALLPQCTRQLDSFKPQEVSSTALAVAKAFGTCDEVDRTCGPSSSSASSNVPPIAGFLQSNQGTLPRQVLEFFNRAMPWAMPRLHEFSAQSLANTVSAFSMVRTPGDPALFSAVGQEVLRRFDHLEPTSLLHLLKGFSGAPKDSCEAVSKLLASQVGRHIDTFRPQELQTLSRICMALSGVRRSRELTCDELRSCCLSYALSGEGETAALFDELNSRPLTPAQRSQMHMQGQRRKHDEELEDDAYEFDHMLGSHNNSTDYPALPHALGKMGPPHGHRAQGRNDYGVHRDQHLPLASLIALDDELDVYDAQGNLSMPAGALFESDFGAGGPPSGVGNHHPMPHAVGPHAQRGRTGNQHAMRHDGYYPGGYHPGQASGGWPVPGTYQYQLHALDYSYPVAPGYGQLAVDGSWEDSDDNDRDLSPDGFGQEAASGSGFQRTRRERPPNSRVLRNQKYQNTVWTPQGQPESQTASQGYKKTQPPMNTVVEGVVSAPTPDQPMTQDRKAKGGGKAAPQPPPPPPPPVSLAAIPDPLAAAIPDPLALPLPAIATLDLQRALPSGMVTREPPTPQLLPGLNEPLAEGEGGKGGQPDNFQWRSSVKNSFLHFQCREGEQPAQGEGQEQQEPEEEVDNYEDQSRGDDGASQRSSSVPPSMGGFDYNGLQSTPRSQQQEGATARAESAEHTTANPTRTLPSTDLLLPEAEGAIAPLGLNSSLEFQ